MNLSLTDEEAVAPERNSAISSTATVFPIAEISGLAVFRWASG
jgi:hypothetical protein